MSVKVYECENKACSLGSRVQPGFFTGGATKEMVTVITGDPEPEHGEGVCPNCGEKATKSHSASAPHEGTDPYEKFHQQVAKKVADEKNPLSADDAQNELMRLADEEMEARGDDHE